MRADASGAREGPALRHILRQRQLNKLSRLQIDLALGNVGQLLVRGLLFAQSLLEHAGHVVMAKTLRPGDERAVASIS